MGPSVRKPRHKAMVKVVADACVPVKPRPETDKRLNSLDNARLSDLDQRCATQLHSKFDSSFADAAEQSKLHKRHVSHIGVRPSPYSTKIAVHAFASCRTAKSSDTPPTYNRRKSQSCAERALGIATARKIGQMKTQPCPACGSKLNLATCYEKSLTAPARLLLWCSNRKCERLGVMVPEDTLS